MSSEQEQQRREIWGTWELQSKLEDIYSEWQANRANPLDGKSRGEAAEQLSCLPAFPHPELLKILDMLCPYPGDEVVHLSVSPEELLTIQQALIVYAQFLEADQYLKETAGKRLKSQERWGNALNLAMLKEPGTKSKAHGDAELTLYRQSIMKGLNPRDAAVEVFKNFSFNTQEACDRWLARAITAIQKQKQAGIPVPFADLPKPHTWPRDE